jgi:hypothetical protein
MSEVPPKRKPVNRHTGCRQPGVDVGVGGTCHLDFEPSLTGTGRDLRHVLRDPAVGRLEHLEDPEHDRILGDLR